MTEEGVASHSALESDLLSDLQFGAVEEHLVRISVERTQSLVELLYAILLGD